MPPFDEGPTVDAPPGKVLPYNPSRRRLPAPLHRHDGRIRQRPTTSYPEVTTVEPRTDDHGGPSPQVRRALADHRRRLNRLNTIQEARALVWLMVGVVCLLTVSVVSLLVVGAMLGQWTIPVGVR